MQNFSKKYLEYLNYGLLVIAVIILGAIYVWAPVCDGSLELTNGNLVHMKCFHTAQGATLITILLLVQTIYSLITKKNNSIMVIALGVMLIAITFESPIGIGICKKAMACHDTAFWLRTGGSVTIALGILAAFNKNKEEY